MRVLCAQGTAPAAATIAKFRELGLTLIPGTGFLAAAIPGAFDGWMLLLRDYGTMTVEQVLEPAIGYAENGFPVLPRVTMSLLPLVEFFKAEWPSSAAVWLPERRAAEAGNAVSHARRRRHLQADRRRGEGGRRRIASARSKPRATPSIAASSPRRSTASRPARRKWTEPAGATSAS